MTTLVNALAGSRLYGTDHADSDYDSMGLFVARPEDRLGLSPTDQIGKDDNVQYELTKYVRLLVGGNPTITQLIYVPDDYLISTSEFWPQDAAALRQLCVTQRCKAAFLGYLDGQRKKILSGRSQRPELIAKFGYDVKFAAHMIRLGFQGIELNKQGTLSFPLPPLALAACKQVLRGEWPQKAVIDLAAALEDELKNCSSVLPIEPNLLAINDYLADTYDFYWSSSR